MKIAKTQLEATVSSVITLELTDDEWAVLQIICGMILSRKDFFLYQKEKTILREIHEMRID